MTSKRIYCDHNATTPLSPQAKEALIESLETYGNPSSLHAPGRQAKECLESARDTCAQAIGATPEQWLFCGSATEANNHVLQRVIEPFIRSKTPVHIIHSTIEHSSVLATIQLLKEWGAETTAVPVDATGVVCQEQYEQAFKPHTKLVSIMMANNELGTLQDCQSLADIAHQHGAYFHSDTVQVLGKLPLNMKHLPCDFATFSAHKLYGPKGIGALFIRNENTLTPLLYGGHHERGLRASTESIPLIASFKAAILAANPTRYITHTRLIRDTFIHAITQATPDCTINGPTLPNAVLSNTVSLTLSGVDGYALAMNADLDGIDLSTGSACSVGSIEPSHVLTAIGLDHDANRASIRLSFGIDTTLDDVRVVAKKLADISQRLRSL